MQNLYDITVIGCGHAGLEAACIAAQFNLKICVITMPDVEIASTPCNPAVGGVGKGQIVREIDALGGVIGKIADQSAIQYRVLNDSKGYAVQSTRVQVDKDLYSENAEKILLEHKNIKLIRAKVEKISREKELFIINVEEFETFISKKVIVTTGTFLAGRLHTGKIQSDGGRFNCKPSQGLNNILSEIKVKARRFKTGTPPRLNILTIDFENLIEQKSDSETRNFHFDYRGKKRFLEQKSCYITNTNEKTLKIIRDNKINSPIFNGQIKGIGPRYCPSIEDKANKYPDRNQHHIFVEPEGLTAKTVYPNGLPTSLPREVQQEFIRTIKGFENAEIEVYGYAVEYDIVETTKLDETLEYHDINGLYFAGQVNGTSGYEEAAAQGLVAGLGASMAVLERTPVIFNRYDSYLGVLIEDIISTARDEPYRLFTARSENRLYCREDNAILRMSCYRRNFGLNDKIDKFQESFVNEYILLSSLCDTTIYKEKQNKEQFFNEGYGKIKIDGMTLTELLQRPELNPVEVLNRECKRFECSFDEDVIVTTAISKNYQGYIEQSKKELEKIEKLDRARLNWEELSCSTNISFECRERIRRVKPKNFGQLRKIEGIRQATLAQIAGKF